MITAWVRSTGTRAFLAPEMTYAVPLLRPLRIIAAKARETARTAMAAMIANIT